MKSQMTSINSDLAPNHRITWDPVSRLRPRLVTFWLILCVAAIFGMALIGAVTRLTESGLSITEWKPITGVIYPQTKSAWEKEFNLYKATPEYKKKNMDLALTEFKSIYFWEWIHRLWGRSIGVLFFIPFLFLWFSKSVSPGTSWTLMGLLALGGAQGFVGWFMVQSGLVDRPSVSHYRLALHLGMALLIYALTIWTALRVSRGGRGGDVYRKGHVILKAHAILSLLLLSTTIIWGAFVAGLDAGLIYNEFPNMGENGLMPKEMWHMSPAWINIFENHAAVQFMHRWLAVTTTIFILALSAHAMLAGIPGIVFPALAAMALIQAGLGISTLLSNVHIHIATTHQAGALVLLAFMVIALYAVFRDSSVRIRTTRA